MNTRTTYHRDGTVTIWDTHHQQWHRLAARRVSARVLATLNETERRRIATMAARSRND